MLKICKEKWDKNKEKLEESLRLRTDLNSCEYKTLVELAIDKILNDEEDSEDNLDIGKITEIDNGDYQGTLIYLIPFDTYQPSAGDYLMTHIYYGSCSGCDVLQGIQSWCDDNKTPTDEQVKDYMSLCKDIITNMIKPYNSGWREDEGYTVVEEERF